jgi:ABC-type multidrug transport system fused ATPase/permease subunit
MTTGDLFAALSVFQALRMALIMIPVCLTIVAAIQVSFGRIQEYLLLPDNERLLNDYAASTSAGSTASIKAGAVESKLSTPGAADTGSGLVEIRNGNFKWATSDFTLSNINLCVEPGKMVAITASVGQGKSSLLNAILGEMDTTGGSVCLQSDVKIGYIAQKPFLFCGTVLENIVVGRPFDQTRFDEVIAASAMETDLTILPDVENTLIGERGTTLSGGQQQRVAIARALYGRPTLLLADDPLAAVDTEVGNRIFESFRKLSREEGGTLVIVLNQSQYLPEFDTTVRLNEGRIEEVITAKQPALTADGPVLTQTDADTTVPIPLTVPSMRKSSTALLRRR